VRHWKLLMLCVVAVFAVAIPAASASAKSGLVLVSSGVPVPTPSAVQIGLSGEGCVVVAEATLTVNRSVKDKVKSGAFVENRCEKGPVQSVSGSLKEVVLTSKGQSEVQAPALEVKLSGGCAYSGFKKIKGEFPVPGLVFGSASGSGKRTKASPKTCASSTTVTFELDVANAEGVLEDEL
jgi:hypothetical protein